jgi:hypothetical protein
MLRIEERQKCKENLKRKAEELASDFKVDVDKLS